MSRSQGMPRFRGIAEGRAQPGNETVRPVTFSISPACFRHGNWISGPDPPHQRCRAGKSFAQQDIRRGVMLTLVSDIAANYFRLIELDQELAIAKEAAGL